MNPETMIIEDATLDWIIRQREPAFDDWEAFAAWLAASPAHAAIYQALATADHAVPALLPPVPLGPALRPAFTRRGWLGGAIAASLVAVAGYALLDRAAPYTVETPAGAPRVLNLADGTQVAMNGGTRLVLDRHDARVVGLERGEALFTVTHDAAAPFRVEVGGATLLDVGTVFNVVRSGGATSVAVAEGAVVYNPGGERVRLSAGRTLRSVDRETRLVLGEIAPGEIGAWRTGRLVYAGVPLALVAEDLTRNLGWPIDAAPAVAQRRFRGVISFDRDRAAVMARLGPLLGVEVRRVGDRWLLAERGK